MADAAPIGAGLDADLVVTGISRLVTAAPPSTLPSARGPLSLIERGALASSGGRIVWVGCEDDLAQMFGRQTLRDAARVDARGHAVLPGFVDSHTHFVFAGDRAEEFQLRHAGVSYEELTRQGRGILTTVHETRAASEARLLELGRARLRSFAAHGTTTVEGKTGYGLDTPTELQLLHVLDELASEPGLPRIVPTFLGAHSFPPEYRGTSASRDRYVALIIEEMLPRFTSLARFCDVFCERGAFSVDEARRVLERARSLGYGLKVHANQLGSTGGARLAAELGAVSADHLDYASDEDLEALREAGTVATLLPGCSFSLSIAYPSARRLYDHGLEVALATDFNPGTSYSENMQMMIALAVSAMGMSLDEALVAATRGGAHALAMDDEVGSLEVGKRCDFTVLSVADERELAYHFGVNLVERTYIGGAAAAG